MKSLRRRGGSMLLAAALALGFVGWAGAQGTMSSLIIVCPSAVTAGQPIVGYAAGGPPPMIVWGTMYGNHLPGSPDGNNGDPNHFRFETLEPMAGTIVTVTAFDPSGGNASQHVSVL